MRCRCILRLGAEDHHLLTAGLEVGQIDARKLVIRFALVHLLLDAATALRRISHVFLELFIGGRSVRVQHLQERADGLLDAFFVAPLNGLAKSNALADFLVSVRVLELVVKGLCQVVGDEAVVTGQEIAAVLRHFPAWNVRGEPVHHRQVEFWRQGLKQIMLIRVHDLLHRYINVADKAQAGIRDDFGPTRETSVGHEVLHDLDGVWIAHFDPANLVKGDRVPESNQPHLATCVVVEQGSLGRLSARDQRGVGRKLAEEIGLASTTRTQLDVVVIGLHQRGKPGNEMHLHAFRELAGFQTNGAQHRCDPLVASKRCSAFCVAIEVEAGQLDRAQVLDGERVVVFVDVVVRQGDFGPNAAFQQPVVVTVELFANRDALRVEVFQRCPVALLFLDVANVNLVDEPVLALGGDLGLRDIGLVWPNVVFLQR